MLTDKKEKDDEDDEFKPTNKHRKHIFCCD